MLLHELDKTIEMESVYDKQKEERISTLKHQLSHCTLPEDIHQTYFDLYKEYEAYVFDSAFHYANIHLTLSKAEQDAYWVNECTMQVARMYSTFVRFQDAIDLLRSIRRDQLSTDQLGQYYSAFAEVYTYWSEYSMSSETLKYTALKNTYQDSALLVLPRNTYGFDINHARKCIDRRDFDQAEESLLPYLSTVEINTRNYAILTSIIAYLYEMKGDYEKQKIYLAQSAIADIVASIKENTSLGNLALIMLNEGEIKRADQYIKKSMEDANLYNARLRNIQVARIMPIIDKAYQVERAKYQKNLQRFTWAIGLLLVLVIGVIFYLIKQMRKLAATRREVIQTNKQLRKMNNYLSEANHIKEEYIGRFLNQCSVYIDKLEAYRKSLNKKAQARKLEELYEMLKSSQLVEDELKEFYQNFDSTFLNLFPDFVEQFNELLPPEERITPKHEAGLTIELRIFALMRLGITDSAKIAGFLRYSITTIYNYRSKYRNRALVPRDRFEEIVMKIGSKK
ncbi:DUF6377 domain-containing protein [Bacteroidales bacterium OttesenSCG-928-L03]|nr:DUF6377 domain-containing protein [Bacteroidales bacterium OttesenSCG-928-L03]